MKYFLQTTFLILLSVILIGCSKPKSGIFFRDTSLQNEKNIAAITENLAGRNIRLFKQVGSMNLVLFNRDFFIGDSANFTNQARDDLELIFSLSEYQKGNTVVITSYTPNGKTGKIEKALAKARAERIMQYLWNSGLQANFVYAQDKDWFIESEKASPVNCVRIEFRDFY